LTFAGVLVADELEEEEAADEDEEEKSSERGMDAGILSEMRRAHGTSHTHKRAKSI
jgi:hypothetical protein